MRVSRLSDENKFSELFFCAGAKYFITFLVELELEFWCAFVAPK